jgi:hypothetical protein
MSWVGPEEYRSAEPDPLHPHADALVSFCRVVPKARPVSAHALTGMY